MFKVIICLSLFFSLSLNARTMNALYSSAISPYVIAPSIFALVMKLTKQDGKVTQYASRNRPLFGTTQRANKYADNTTFVLLPIYSALTTVFALQTSDYKHQHYLSYASFVPAPLATYFVNNLIKDKVGRLRPDGSNFQSFPSSHTALASSFVGYTNENLKILNHEVPIFIQIFNEFLVLSVGWARLEAKRHRLSDILVGHSIGRFFSLFVHKMVFKSQKNISLQMNLNSLNEPYGSISWSY